MTRALSFSVPWRAGRQGRPLPRPGRKESRVGLVRRDAGQSFGLPVIWWPHHTQLAAFRSLYYGCQCRLPVHG